MANPIEQKLAQQLGAQQLEIIRLQGVIEMCQEEIKRLQAELKPSCQAERPGDVRPEPANGHDVVANLPN